MATTSVYIEIQADDPSRAAAFYEAVFHWTAQRDPAVAAVEYWRWHSAETGIHGGLLKRPAAAPGPHMGTNAFVCSLQVNDFDATAAIILGQGGQVALPKFAIPGKCWQGYFLDTEGNTFGIFQVDEQAK